MKMKMTIQSHRKERDMSHTWKLLWQSRPVKARSRIKKTIYSLWYIFFIFIYIFINASTITLLGGIFNIIIPFLIVIIAIVFIMKIKHSPKYFAVYDKGMRSGNWMIPWDEVVKVKYLGNQSPYRSSSAAFGQRFKIITIQGHRLDFIVNQDQNHFNKSMEGHESLLDGFESGTDIHQAPEHMIRQGMEMHKFIKVIVLAITLCVVLVAISLVGMFWLFGLPLY